MLPVDFVFHHRIGHDNTCVRDAAQIVHTVGNSAVHNVRLTRNHKHVHRNHHSRGLARERERDKAVEWQLAICFSSVFTRVLRLPHVSSKVVMRSIHRSWQVAENPWHAQRNL